MDQHIVYTPEELAKWSEMNDAGLLRKDQFESNQEFRKAVHVLRSLGKVPPGNWGRTRWDARTEEERLQVRRRYYKWWRKQQAPGYNNQYVRQYIQRKRVNEPTNLQTE